MMDLSWNNSANLKRKLSSDSCSSGGSFGKDGLLTTGQKGISDLSSGDSSVSKSAGLNTAAMVMNGNGRAAKSLFSIRDLVKCDSDPRGKLELELKFLEVTVMHS